MAAKAGPSQGASEDALWKRVGAWSYYHYDRHTPADAFGPYAPPVDMWHGKKNGRELPAWRDFDFYDFIGWHGWICVFDIRHDPFDWTCRLSGTHVDELTGRSFQGKSRAHVYDQAITESTMEFFEHALTHGKIGWCVGPINLFGREHIHAQYLELPCSNDGRSVDTVIEIMISRKSYSSS